MTLFSRLSGAALLAGVLIAPLPTLAATTQQILDQAFKNTFTQKNVAQGLFDLTKTETPLRKQEVASKESGRIGFAVEKPLTATTTQGFIELQSFSETVAGKTAPLISSPLRLSFRDTDSGTFLRLENVASLLAVAGLTDIPQEQLSALDQWYKLDLSQEDSSFLPLALPAAGYTDDLAEFKQLMALATTKKISPFQVITVKAVAKQPNIRRIQFRVNPALVALAQQAELKLAKTAAQKKVINDQYVKVRAMTKTMQFAANVNIQDAKLPVIDRLEMYVLETETKQGCGYKTYDRAGEPVDSSYSCTLNTHRVTTEVRGGINFSRKTDVTVTAPANAASLKDAIEQALNYFLGGAFGGNNDEIKTEDAL